jgi:hypothetical protein
MRPQRRIPCRKGLPYPYIVMGYRLLVSCMTFAQEKPFNPSVNLIMHKS